MHKYAKEIMEQVKAKVCAKGVDNLNEADVCELEKWSCIVKNIAEMDYYYNIVKAMEESGAEYGEDYDYQGLKYYGRRRDSRGRYMYSEPRMYHDDMMDMDGYKMSMDDYKHHSAQELRDMDKQHGKMYYSAPNRHFKRYYEHKGTMDEATKLKSLEDDLKEISEEVTQMVGEMNATDKQMLRTKLQNITQMI